MEIVASSVLGVVFLLAGGSKIAAGERWPAQARDLGAPPPVVPVLPWVEIGIGALLVTRLLLVPAAVLAAVLLVAFSGLIALRLAQGERPTCACFGAWSASPIGARHLVRNAVFLVLAVVVASTG